MVVHIHFHERGLLPKLRYQIAAFYDWLSGPPMTEHERITRAVAEAEGLRHMGGRGW